MRLRFEWDPNPTWPSSGTNTSPSTRNTAHPTPAGSYLQPWVRLHAIRDYYSMAALVAEHPALHLTINLTPALLWQIEDYTEHDATDRALDLTLKSAETLTAEERAFVLANFFDAHWHNQIFPHPRYKELFAQRREGKSFTAQDLSDLQMWFNLAWFGQEFRETDVTLMTGEVVAVRRFVEQARNFSQSDVEAMVAEQYKIMRAVILLHRQLQDQGQIEVATTPFFYPILPLLVDTDQATIDRPGATHPRRFAHPEDAEAQVRLAAEAYRRWFGRAPRGMWPSEGAISQAALPLFTASWIDENGSTPGVELGTWIGEAEENRGWELLADARDALGPFPQQVRAVGFVFRCTHPGCDGQDICCEAREYTVCIG